MTASLKNGQETYQPAEKVAKSYSILFLLFILDINNYLPEEVELLKYADDILTYVIGDVPAHMPQAIANAIHRWCEDNTSMV